MSQKIETIKIKNFKVLENFEAELKGKNIYLKGENGLGKTSVQQFIKIALGSDSVPLATEGEGEMITIKDGRKFHYKVKVADGKSKVVIKSDDHFVIDKKGGIRDFVGAVDFDINEFVALSSTSAGRKKQVEIFKSFLPSDCSAILKEIEDKIKSTYDSRTDLGREIKTLKSQIDSSPMINDAYHLDDFKEEKLDDVFSHLAIAEKQNKLFYEYESREKSREEKLVKLESDAKDLQIKLESVRHEYANLREQKDSYAAWKIKDENKLIDTSSFQQKITENNAINEKAKEAKALKANIEKIEKWREEEGAMTALIEMKRHSVEDTIKDVNIIEGLKYDEEGLIYNTIPVSSENLSTSEIMELGFKMKIAENPDLGIIFLGQSESIGNERMRYLLDIAKKMDLQIIAEEVVRGLDKLTVEIINE